MKEVTWTLTWFVATHDTDMSRNGQPILILTFINFAYQFALLGVLEGENCIVLDLSVYPNGTFYLCTKDYSLQASPKIYVKIW